MNSVLVGTEKIYLVTGTGTCSKMYLGTGTCYKFSESTAGTFSVHLSVLLDSMIYVLLAIFGLIPRENA